MLEPFHGPFREGHGQLNRENSGHAKWLQASTNGHVLMISGNHPVITETRLDMDPATGRARRSPATFPVRDLTGAGEPEPAKI